MNNAKSTAVLNAEALRRSIEILEEESIPYDVTYRRISKGVWRITIYSEGNRQQHFKNLLSNLSNDNKA